MAITFTETMTDFDKGVITDVFEDVYFTTSREVLVSDKDMEKKRAKLGALIDKEISFEVLQEGDIKTLSDGTQYLVTNSGWRKL